MKSIRYFFEGFGLKILFVFFKILPAETASNIGGWLGQTIGMTLAANRKARRHIKIVFPDADLHRENEILKGMWNHLGRLIAEYPHLEKLSRNDTKIIYLGDTEKLTQEQIPMIFFGGHIGNWEVNCAATLTQMNRPATLTYRAPNNPITAKLLDKARTLNSKLTAYPKSRESGRYLLKTLKEAGTIGILIDQKYNEGINVPFFGRDAMTNPVFVQLCQKFKCPLIPIRNERLNGCDFQLTIYPPIPVMTDEGQPRPIEDVMKDANHMLENWIKERPDQWIWMHRRWKDDNI